MENSQNSRSKFEILKLLRKSIYRQAILAILLILLTVVLLFAISTAWYTNVAQTSGLMFEVAKWGFEGEIQVPETAILAGPGDEGSVYMELENASDSVVDVSVYVDKRDLGDRMKERLFFYVETSDYINDESVDRIYLTQGSGYDYTVVGKGNLTLDEDYHNDAQIKWEWVYDMLGYYVTGTLETTQAYTTLADNVPVFESGTVDVEEILRPIEYDYDEAKTTFEMEAVTDEDGTTRQIPTFVETIDGTTTVGDFLEKITGKDGYPGTVDSETVRTSDGFYPVSVDAQTGYGVWAYLCTYSEIEAGILFDTQQGETAAKGETESHKVTLNITAQKSDMTTTVVDTQAEFAAALTQSGTSVIQLASDLTLNPVDIPAGKDIVLDLNKHTLNYPDTGTYDAMMDLGEGSSVTILNGSIVGEDNMLRQENAKGFNVTGAELTLSGVTTSGIGRLINVKDSSGTGTDSKIRLLNCNVNAAESAVYMIGNGVASDNLSQLVVEGTTITTDYVGILCNGNPSNPGNWGTDIMIIDSTITGAWGGVYHPQQESTMTIYNSTIEGYTGLALKGGYIKVLDSTVIGTGEPPVQMSASESGWTDTGDGVYVEANYEWNTTVEIYNSTVSATGGGFAVRKYEADATNATILVYSGEYSNDVTSYLAAGSMQNGTTVTTNLDTQEDPQATG